MTDSDLKVYSINHSTSQVPPMSDTILVSHNILRLLENCALLVGILKFHHFMRKNNDNSTEVQGTVRDCCSSACTQGTLWLTSFAIPYAAMRFTPIVFFLTIEKPLSLWCLYSGVMFAITMSDGLKIVSMIFVAVVVRSRWCRKLEHMKEKLSEAGITSTSEQLSNTGEVKDIIDYLIEDYKKTGRIVTKLQGIFKHWFILQWISFFVSVVLDISLTFQLLLNGNFSSSLWTHSLFVLSDTIAFVTPYICGNVVNHYHHKYRRKLKKALRNILITKCSVEGDVLLWFMQCRKMIPTEDKYHFIPSIIWIKAPLDNPGYIFSILLALISFLFDISLQYTWT